MTSVSIGDIWSLRNTEKLGIVVFIRPESEDRPEDLRLVPIYTEPAALQRATHRDLVIPAEMSSVGKTILVASWNARGLDSSFLGRRVGTVAVEVIEAARTAEMAGIIPNIEMGSAAIWQGARPVSKKALARTAAFQESELEVWDALIRSLSAREEPEMIVLEQFEHNAVTYVLRRSASALGDVAVGVPITHSFEGVQPAFYFYGGVDMLTDPPGSPGSVSLASRTAPNGAVLVSSGKQPVARPMALTDG